MVPLVLTVSAMVSLRFVLLTQGGIKHECCMQQVTILQMPVDS